MSNKVKAMSHSIIDVGGKIGLGELVDATKVLLQLFGKLVVALLV